MLIKQTEDWVPSKIHGEIELPVGVDMETAIVAALKNSLQPWQIPVYTNILYRIKTSKTIALSGTEKHILGNIKMRTVFFELA